MHYLSKSERLLIELKRREVRTKKEHVRLTVLIMLDEGFSQETIALCLGIHSDTVSNWKQKYEAVSRNLHRYLSDHYVAFSGYLSNEQLLEFDAHLQAQPALTSRQAENPTRWFISPMPPIPATIPSPTMAGSRKESKNKLPPIPPAST
jgi:hypothetical protein